MAQERRSEILYKKVQELPANQKKGRRNPITAVLVSVIGAAMKPFDALQAAKATFDGVRENMDKAIAKAGALFALDVWAHIMPGFTDAVNPYAVWADTWGAQWSLVSEQLIKLRGVTKDSTKEAKADAQKYVNKLRGSWSQAQLVMYHASKGTIAEYAKGTYPTGLQKAYRARLAKLNANRPPTAARIKSLTETLGGFTVEGLKAVPVEALVSLREAVAKLATVITTAGRAAEPEKIRKHPKRAAANA